MVTLWHLVPKSCQQAAEESVLDAIGHHEGAWNWCLSGSMSPDTSWHSLWARRILRGSSGRRTPNSGFQAWQRVQGWLRKQHNKGCDCGVLRRYRVSVGKTTNTKRSRDPLTRVAPPIHGINQATSVRPVAQEDLTKPESERLA